MEVVRVGQHALLVECADADAVAATYAALRGRAGDLGATDVVPAALTVLVDGLADVARAVDVLAQIEVRSTAVTTSGDLVEIPTTYDGPDLDEVARQWDVTTDEVVRLHQATEFTVAFCGFAPGFAYCTGLPAELSVARRDEPRPSVPTGSVALAGSYTSIYPTSSPGGWQLIGTSAVALWRPDRTPPALLSPGTRVRFVDD